MIINNSISFDLTEQEEKALEDLMVNVAAKGAFSAEERHAIYSEMTETALLYHETGYYQGLRDALDPRARASLERALKEYEAEPRTGTETGGSRPS